MRLLQLLFGSLAIVSAVAAPVGAQTEKGFVRGLAGVTFGAETSTIFGGGFGWTVAPNLQITAEVGRMQNVIPGEIQDLLDEFNDFLVSEAGIPVDLDVAVPVFYFLGGA